MSSDVGRRLRLWRRYTLGSRRDYLQDVALTPATQAIPGRRKPGIPLRRRLLVGSAVDAFGTGLSSVGTVLYFVHFVGLSAGLVGSAMSAGAALGIATPLLLGRLADRSSTKIVYIAALTLRGCGYCLLPFATHPIAFILAALFVFSVESTTRPLQQTYLMEISQRGEYVRAMGMIGAARNCFLGIGTILATLALATDSRTAVAAMLAINGCSFIFMAGVVRSIPSVRQGEVVTPGSTVGRVRRSGALRDRPFMTLSLSNGVLGIHDSLLFVFLPLSVVGQFGLNPAWAGVLLTLYTVLTVGLQWSLPLLLPTTQAQTRSLSGSTAFLLVGVAILATSSHMPAPMILPALVTATVALALSDNVHAIAGYALSHELAPERDRAEYVAVFNTGFALQAVIGPPIAVTLYKSESHSAWIALAVISVVALGALRIAERLTRSARLTEKTEKLEEHVQRTV